MNSVTCLIFLSLSKSCVPFKNIEQKKVKSIPFALPILLAAHSRAIDLRCLLNFFVYGSERTTLAVGVT